MPKMTPGQGRSEFTGFLNKWKASSRGMPQVVLGTRIAGMALPYPSIKASQPPTLSKPETVDSRVGHSGGDARSCQGHIWLTEAHENEGSHQHDGSLSSVCVDDGCQPTWDTRAQRRQTLSSSPGVWSTPSGWGRKSPATV